jgi:hypothetical protein
MAVGLVVGLYWAHLEKQHCQRQVLWEWLVGEVQHVHLELVFLALMQVTGVATM